VADRVERLPHLFPQGITESSGFTAPGTPRDPNKPPAFPRRTNPAAHARHLLADLGTTASGAATLGDDRKTQLLDDCEGIFIDIEFIPNADFPLKSLSDERAGIELIAVTDLSPQLAQATVFVPDGKLRVLESKIRDFAPTDPTKRPRNVALVSSLEAIRRSVAESFWTDPVAPFPKEKGSHWWEVWIRKTVSADRFRRHEA
jgi:hypothetical protein